MLVGVGGAVRPLWLYKPDPGTLPEGQVYLSMVSGSGLIEVRNSETGALIYSSDKARSADLWSQVSSMNLHCVVTAPEDPEQTPGEIVLEYRYVNGAFQCADRVKVTVVNVDLDIEGVPDNSEMSTGGYVFVNHGEEDLVPITISYFPSVNFGQIQIEAPTWGSKIHVWLEDSQNHLVPLPQTRDLATQSIPNTLYIEGVEASGSRRDVELRLFYSYSSGGIILAEDRVKFTVVDYDFGTPCISAGVGTTNEYFRMYYQPPTLQLSWESSSASVTEIRNRAFGGGYSWIDVTGVSEGACQLVFRFTENGSVFVSIPINTWNMMSVPVHAKICKDIYGAGSQLDEDDVMRFFEGANGVWEQAGIEFDPITVVERIVPTSLLYIDQDNAGDLLATGTDPSSVDVFFVETMPYAGLGNDDYAILPNNLSIKALAHELGHALSLDHDDITPCAEECAQFRGNWLESLMETFGGSVTWFVNCQAPIARSYAQNNY